MAIKNEDVAALDRPIPSQAEGEDPPQDGAGTRPVPSQAEGEDMGEVRVYGADWCGMTTRTLEFLDSLGVAYEYVNVEKDPRATEWVKRQADGKVKKPTLDIGGTILVTPDNEELEEVLRSQGLLGS